MYISDRWSLGSWWDMQLIGSVLFPLLQLADLKLPVVSNAKKKKILFCNHITL